MKIDAIISFFAIQSKDYSYKTKTIEKIIEVITKGSLDNLRLDQQKERPSDKTTEKGKYCNNDVSGNQNRTMELHEVKKKTLLIFVHE